MNRTWDAIRENINILAKESTGHVDHAINHGLMRNVQNWLNEGS
jgi:hypothetical protein